MLPAARNVLYLLIAGAFIIGSCRPASVTIAKSNMLAELLSRQSPEVTGVIAQKDSFKVQVIYTKIDRDANQRPRFTDYYFNVDTAAYFYPASTIKMPLAFLALEKAQWLRKGGIALDRNSTMITEQASLMQTAVYNDPTSEDGRPTLGHYIKKIFLVSDNDASNRLYEFLGQEYIQSQLSAKGYPSAQIIHRLSTSLPDAENRHTNPVSFFDTAGQLLYKQSDQKSKLNFLSRKDAVGKGYISRGNLVNAPMDFSTKNRVYLTDLHNMLRSFIFPEAVPPAQRFDVSQNDRSFALQMMSQLPRETRYPDYSDPEHYDSYVKFFMFGHEKKQSMPAHIRIFNKVGWAYGFLTDVAYVVDFKNNIEFMLSATVYCNNDEVLNDDRYEFETVGLPFLGKLGQAVYEMELKRKRKHQPNLSDFKLTYEK